MSWDVQVPFLSEMSFDVFRKYCRRCRTRKITIAINRRKLTPESYGHGRTPGQRVIKGHAKRKKNRRRQTKAIFNPVFKASRSRVFAPFFNKGMAALKSPPKILPSPCPLWYRLPSNGTHRMTFRIRMALVHPNSCEYTKSELALFEVPPTQISAAYGYWEQKGLTSALTDQGPYEFTVSGAGDDYIDCTTWLPLIEILWQLSNISM
jgi:hypothetical protein